MAKCLVLGSNGFIGSHVVDSLITKGHYVRAFDRTSSSPKYVTNENIDVFEGDFLNRADLENAVDGMDYVFHFISTTTPVTAEKDPIIDIETNIKMSVILFQICAANNIKRIIFPSTGGAIYGNQSKSAYNENDTTIPTSPYAIGKLTIENYLRYFRAIGGLDSLILRVSNPYGERQPLHSKQGVIPIFIENVLTHKPVLVYGDGTMVRDYLYVKDAADIITTLFNRETKYNTYNIGSGTGITVNEVLEKIEDKLNQKADITHADVPPTFIDKVVLDITRLNEELPGYKFTDMKDGIINTINYISGELANK